MLLVIGIHVLLTVVTAALAERVGPKIFLVAALGPVSGVVLLALSAHDVLSGHAWSQSYRWVPGISLEIGLRLDPLSWLMLVLVSGVGTMIFVFTAWYAHRDETLTRFVSTLTAFAGAMVGLVLSDNVLSLYLFWELTSITSFLLVGLNTTDPVSRRAAMQALLITMMGGLSMLLGLVMLSTVAGTWRLSELLAAPPEATPVVQAGLALVLVGALTKSAQAPFHIWLPGAMAAPTPVSAYLHAAAMVKAGIYLIARFSPTFAEDITWWRPVLVAAGVTTMLLGGWRALRQHDLKRLLAFSTVSQLGFLTIVAGWGSEASQAALALLLLTHGFAKAALFCSLGAVDHQAHTRDLHRLSGMGRRMPVLAGAAWVAALSMAGIPPLLGFVAKEEVLGLLVEEGAGLATAALVGVVLGSAMTLAYGLRYCWGAFATKNLPDGDPDHSTDQIRGVDVRRPSSGMVAPITVLSLFSLGLGLRPATLDHLVAAVTGHEEHLALWHGLNLPLMLSMLIIVAGLALFALRPRFMRLQDGFCAVSAPFDADHWYDRTLHLVDRTAGFVTGRTQIGSLPFYLGVIVFVAVTGPGLALVFGTTPLRPLPLIDSPAQAPVVLVTMVAALLACFTRVRLTAVLLLGAVGYGMATIYALHGAPDLALTQLLVETLSIVVFLFVMRLLPYRYPDAVPGSWNRAKALVAISVGVLATSLVLLASNPYRTSEVGPSVATGMLEGSYTQAHGRNVVNVILVDFRGLDTLGEATVVLVAALGIASLVMTARRPPPTPRGAKAPPGDDPLPRPSTLLRVAVRVTFHATLATAMYLLFAGHNNPGGGFIAGLVAGAAFMLRYLSADVSVASTPLHPRALLALGLVLASGTATAPLITGTDLLTSTYVSGELPLLGSVSMSSVLIFDTGVFLIVVGITLVILDTLGSRKATSLGVVNEDVKL
ncbi:MAG: hydrogen gas-evolving membrane-bound hydrogenase subunit E [Actinomycetales bacterium]